MQTRIIKYVATNDRGYRIGQDHQGAKLTDAEIEQIRDLHEIAGWGYRAIARAYGVHKDVVGKICRYERRAQTVFDWKKVVVIPGSRIAETVSED